MTQYFKRYTAHYRSLLTMGVPIMVGQLGIILTGFVDNIMVGHHMTDELSAASFVNNIFLLPLILVLPMLVGIDGVMYAGPIADFAASILALLMGRAALQQMKKQELQQQMQLV